jgi:hypothetical protein
MSGRNAAFRTAVLGVLLAALAVWRVAADGNDLAWRVVGGGGGPLRSEGYAIHGTVGQAAIGVFASRSYRQGAGYWYAAGRPDQRFGQRMYLPFTAARASGAGIRRPPW